MGHYGWGIDSNNYTIPHNAPARFAVYDWHRDQKPVYEQGYSKDLIANETVRLLGEQSAEKPFFFYVPFNAVHRPLEQIPRYTDTLEQRYADLKCLDDAVGRIVGAVDQAGFGKNTVVTFANDNGGLREEMNAPYRSTKNTNYEGGVRVPFVMRWPDRLAAGAENESLFHIVDLYNTFVELAGGTLQQELPLDGLSMLPSLFGKEKSPREEIIFAIAGSVRLPTILRGNYKLTGEELYDLAADPSEKNDIAAQHPEIVTELKARLAEMATAKGPLHSNKVAILIPS